MSYLDPYGSATPRGDGARRARHADAAPEPYAPERWYDQYPDSGYAGGPYGGSGERAYRHGEGLSPYQRIGGDRDGGVGHPPLAQDDTAGWPLTAVDPPPPPPRSRAGRRRAGARRKANSSDRAAEGSQRSSDRSQRPSRAGRNLPAAIGVGVALVLVIIASLVYWRPAFLGVLAVAVSVGIWEMVRAVRPSGARPPLAPLLAGGLLMVGMAWYAGPDALCLGLLVTVLATMVWRLADGPAGYQRDLTAATLIAVYVPFLAGFAALLAVRPDGDLRILVTLAAVVLSDTGGYVAGVFLGKHPMAPSVSPKKSWEGFAGSLTATAGGSALLLYFLLDVPPWWGAAFGLAVSVAAVLGDLGESMIKRDLGIKDMSNLLPGHGGLMDRLDSILFAVPTAFLLLALFAPTG